MILLGFGQMALGGFIRFKIGRRKFKRRTITGSEWFPGYSYERVIFTKTWEGVAVLLAAFSTFIGFVLILRCVM